jgi:adenine-specific DNA-methyltransferase
MAARRTPKITASALAELPKEDLLALVERVLGGTVTVTFSGKADAARVARKVRPRIVRRVKTLSAGTLEGQAANALIEGDNLQAMSTLYRERGHVDLILTDPPYNTGNDFRYNDKWETDPNDQGMGEFISADDGARHTKWMRFMWPRLQMMRSMLKPGGVLAICIDQRELFHLGQMLDELFGEQNRIAIINWQRAASLRNDKVGVSTATEYILVYAKNREKAKTGRLDRTEEHDSGYQNPDGDPDGPWTGVSPFAPGAKTHRGMVYGVQHPFTGRLIYPSGDQCWKRDKATIKSWFEAWGGDYVETPLGDGKVDGLLIKGAKDPRTVDPDQDPAVKRARRKATAVMKGVLPPLVFTKKGYGLPRLKTHLGQLQTGVVPSTFWSDEDYYEPVPIESAAWASSESRPPDVVRSSVRGQGWGLVV